MKKNYDIWTYSAKFLAGEMTGEEKTEFFKWLGADWSRMNEFERMKEIWNSAHADYSENLPDSKKAWDDLFVRLGNDGLIPEKELPSPLINRQIWAIAAGIVLLLSIGITLLYRSSLKNNTGQELVKYEAREGSSIFNLPDGSRIFLNEGSVVSFNMDVRSNRMVDLQGEAYFNVTPDSLKEFTVNMKNSSVKVLGTSFNVKENAENNQIEVLVESGKVWFQNKSLNEGLFLAPGQFGKSGKNSIGQMVQDDINYLSWKTREFKFTDVSIGEIMKTLERAYYIKIVIEDPEIYNKRLTSAYSEQSIDTILETICIALNLNFSKSGKEYRIFNN